MRLLTLNTHSLIEKDYERKLEIFCRGVMALMPDVIALQEVNQSRSACSISDNSSKPPVCVGNTGFYPLRCDNHILRVHGMLLRMGLDYRFVWRGMKESYGMYDEGLGILARAEIDEVEFVPITPPRNDWRMRYALGVRVGDVWYYSVHTGRWDDNEVSFKGQIERLCDTVRQKRAVIMGDFNCPDKSEGYEILKATGWQDIWGTAPVRCGCATAMGNIDGWSEGEKMMRIDYVFSSIPLAVSECRVVFSKHDYGVVSDHRGVFAECNTL